MARQLKRVLRSPVQREGMRALLKNMEEVDIKSVKLHPDNPREGDVELIAESLMTNGQYKPIVVQRSTKHIIAGNHTWLGARSLNWPTIYAVFVDVDDDEATRIMLADNKTAMGGSFSEELLGRLLGSLKNIKGTGYDQGEADALIERNRMLLHDTMHDVAAREERERQAIQEAKDSTKFDRVPLGEEEDAEAVSSNLGGLEDIPDEALEDGRLEKAEDELAGAFQLKPDLAFDQSQSVGEWEWPKLRRDMLMTWDEVPDNLKAWAGSATKDWPEDDVWWLYNFGIDSTSGMRDVSKVIVSFYCYDKYFEAWWNYPDRFVTKLLNSGIKYIVMPDFSMHEVGAESRTISVWNRYRAHWMARYFQEAGLKVIPNVTWATADEAFLKKHILPALPKNLPLLAMQIQTVDDKHPDYMKNVAQIQHVLDTLQPEGLILYYGKQGKVLFDKHIKYDGHVKFVASRMHALSEKAKLRQKKRGL